MMQLIVLPKSILMMYSLSCGANHALAGGQSWMIKPIKTPSLGLEMTHHLPLVKNALCSNQ